MQRACDEAKEILPACESTTAVSVQKIILQTVDLIAEYREHPPYPPLKFKCTHPYDNDT